MLKADDDSVEDNTVVIGAKKRFNLQVHLERAAGNLDEYDIHFGLATNPDDTPTDALTYTFPTAAETTRMQAFTSGNDRDDDLSSGADEAHWLSFDADETAEFCDESAVYLVAWIEFMGGSPPPDADDRNDRSVKKINFVCHRGENTHLRVNHCSSKKMRKDLCLCRIYNQ